MAKIYTKNGDRGTTNLYDMRKLGKDDLFFEVLGDIDELSSHIGLARILLSYQEMTTPILLNIQRKLMDISSDIATTKEQAREKLKFIDEIDTKKLEVYIDEFWEDLPKLTEFIIPGYKQPDAQIHICRAICRRVERHMWALRKQCEANETPLATSLEVFKYINRLSDFFFALARVFSQGKDVVRSEI